MCRIGFQHMRSGADLGNVIYTALAHNSAGTEQWSWVKRATQNYQPYSPLFICNQILYTS